MWCGSRHPAAYPSHFTLLQRVALPIAIRPACCPFDNHALVPSLRCPLRNALQRLRMTTTACQCLWTWRMLGRRLARGGAGLSQPAAWRRAPASGSHSPCSRWGGVGSRCCLLCCDGQWRSQQTLQQRPGLFTDTVVLWLLDRLWMAIASTAGPTPRRWCGLLCCDGQPQTVQQPTTTLTPHPALLPSRTPTTHRPAAPLSRPARLRRAPCSAACAPGRRWTSTPAWPGRRL